MCGVYGKIDFTIYDDCCTGFTSSLFLASFDHGGGGNKVCCILN